MSKNFLGSLLLAGACSLASLSVPALAQQAGTVQQGGVQGGGAPMTQRTQEPQTPNANGPMATDQTSTTSTPARVDDKKFLKEAAKGNTAEVELGKLALQNSSNDNVKAFAKRLVDDHTKCAEQLKQVASKENMEVPTEAEAKTQSKLDKLGKLSGQSFDKAFLKDAVKEHKSDIRMFQSEAQGGTNPAIKQFASQTLPTLQQHLELAKNLNKTGTLSSASTGTN
jgi:putative membrane protein